MAKTDNKEKSKKLFKLSRGQQIKLGVFLILLSIIVAFICQLGDLFISFLKRKARVKDTGDLLPGHGGFLDRIDGILLAVPIGIFLWKFLCSYYNLY